MNDSLKAASQPLHESIWQTRRKSDTAHDAAGAAGDKATAAPDFIERNVDVIVVGGGITGVLTAYLLKEGGQKVALITDHQIGDGATGSSTGHLTIVDDAHFKDHIAKWGVDKTRRIVNASRYSVDMVERIVDRLNLREAVGFERVPGFKFVETAAEREALEEEFDACEDLGLDVKLLERAPLPFETAGAIEFANQALFDPLAFVRAVSKLISGDGSCVVENIHVTGYDDRDPCVVHTDHGELRAGRLVLATHTPIGMQLSLHTRVAPYFSYVGAAKVRNAGAAQPGLYWDMQDPYHYLRPLSSEASDLWVVGGYDNKTGQESEPEKHYAQLQSYVKERFEVSEFQNLWGNEVFESVDDLPFIGTLPSSSRVYVATGFAGTGLSMGALSAQLISDSILGRENAWAGMFSPSRVNALNAFSRFVSENANVAKEMVAGWMHSYPHENIESIPRDHGEVMEIGGQKVAVHKDRDGRLYFFSPTCPHMGGIVRWNGAEKTWDCPLHGGRFASTGEVLNGPPMHALKQMGEVGDNVTPQNAEALQVVESPV